jgi:PAS domain S-box-containing protein
MAENGGRLFHGRRRLPRRRKLDQSLEQLSGFVSTFAAHARGRLRSLAATRHSIGARLLIGILVFSGSVTLILTAIQLYFDYRRDVSAIDFRLNQISGSYLNSLAEDLWPLDEKRLQLRLYRILQLPDISAVEVSKAGTPGDPFVVRLGQKSGSSAITREYPLRYKAQGQDRVIGTLRVEATLADVYRRLVGSALTILGIQAIQIFFVSLFILYIFHYLVTRHLSAIAAYVGSYRIDDSTLELRLRRRSPRHEDELERVITALNTLSHDLQIAYRDLHDVNDKLAADVAARRRAEAVLREREARIRRLVDANIIGIIIWDLEGRILEANDAFLRMVGYDREDLASGGLNRTDLTPAEWRDRDTRTAAELKMIGTVQPFEKEYFRKDASRVPVLIGAALFEESGSQGVSFVLDLTERKRAEAEARENERRYRETLMGLAHANRVTTMGQLTASIAHEVNQPIAAAVLNAEAALSWLGAQPPALEKVRKSLGQIVEDGRRAGNVIGGIRALIKKAPARKDCMDINEPIREVIALTRIEAAKTGVSVQTDLADGLPLIYGDRVQLQQVILNLIINAIEAMSSVAETPRALLISTGQAEPGGVLVTVRDTGPGLDPSSVDRLFEAFYTTKPEGMGMGLSISRSIIEDYGGRLWASANVPRGAMFQFTVPARETVHEDPVP